MFDNMYEVRIANSGDVAGFPRSHDGLEKAIILASREGTEVTFDGDVVWPEEEPDMDESMDGIMSPPWPVPVSARMRITVALVATSGNFFTTFFCFLLAL